MSKNSRQRQPFSCGPPKNLEKVVIMQIIHPEPTKILNKCQQQVVRIQTNHPDLKKCKNKSSETTLIKSIKYYRI